MPANLIDDEDCDESEYCLDKVDYNSCEEFFVKGGLVEYTRVVEDVGVNTRGVLEKVDPNVQTSMWWMDGVLPPTIFDAPLGDLDYVALTSLGILIMVHLRNVINNVIHLLSRTLRSAVTMLSRSPIGALGSQCG